MKPYSQDLREKIVRALEAQDETQEEVAARFSVSPSFVVKLTSMPPRSSSQDAQSDE